MIKDGRIWVLIGFFQAVVATLSSLYLSDVLNWKPCVLCWYQRVLMYPLIWILLVGFVKRDKNLPLYVLPLSILGGLFALYHYLLQMGYIPQSQTPCTYGVSCVSRYAAWFGFVNIPLLSLIAFVVISASMVLYRRSHELAGTSQSKNV